MTRHDQSYPPHLRERIHEILNAPIQKPPVPWVPLPCCAVGGLVEVGFSQTCDYIMIVSHDGRGVFDCSTGERVARDRSPLVDSETWHDFSRLQAEGIGPVSGETISLCGLWGGGLSLQTHDGWSVEAQTFCWPDQTLILTSPDHPDIFDRRKPFAGTIIGVESGVRAFGFSHSGKHLVLATSDSLQLWVRR